MFYTSITEDRVRGGFNCTFSVTVDSREPAINSGIVARKNIGFGKSQGYICGPIRLNVIRGIDRPLEL